MRSRRGVALPELLFSLLLLAIVGGAIHSGLRRQQQGFRSIALMIAVRGDVRDAAEVLAADLLTASPLDTLSLAADSAVEFYSTIVTSLSCDSAPGYTIRLPPDAVQNGLALTTTAAPPDTGDVLLLYNDDTLVTAEPRWDRHVVASVSSQSSAAACPASTGFTALADATAPSHVITLRGPAHSGVRRGAPVRIIRRGRYSLYRSSDSKWYLGYRRCNSSGTPACGTIQPLGGPYEGYAGGGLGGLALHYFDASGNSLSAFTAQQAAARIELAVRARSAAWVNLGRAQSAPFRDSTTVVVALRNRD